MNTDSMNAVLHEEYVKAKNSVAVMMGMDPMQFTDKDFKVCHYCHLDWQVFCSTMCEGVSFLSL